MPGPRFLWVSPKCSLQSILEEIYQIYIQILSASHMKSNPLPVSPIKPSSKSSNVGFCLNLHLFSRSFPLSPPVTAVANVRPVGSGLAHPWHHCGAAMVAANIGGFGADQSYGEFIYGYIYNIYIYVWLYYTKAELNLLYLARTKQCVSTIIDHDCCLHWSIISLDRRILCEEVFRYLWMG